MAPLPVIPNVFRIAVGWIGAGVQTATNVIHIEDTVGLRTAQDAAEIVNSKWHTNMIQTSSNLAAVMSFTAIVLDGSGESWEHVRPVGIYGQGASEFMPSTCAMIKLKTGLRGRSRRGRIYLPFQSESLWAYGSVQAEAIPLVNTAWATFMTGLGSEDWQLVVASYVLADSRPVTTATLEAAAGTQRRRQSRLRV